MKPVSRDVGVARERRRITTLPKSLRRALVELEKDLVVRAALGEYERYRRAVHPWECEAYLRVY